MADFEAECQRRNIDLDVPQPRSLKLRRGVARRSGALCGWRAPRTTRDEFYACSELLASVEALNPLIDNWQHTYNFVRPHRAFSGSTPAEYVSRETANGVPPMAHMS